MKPVCCSGHNNYTLNKVLLSLKNTLCSPESSLKMKDDRDMKDNEACSTISDMTDNPAYGTTRKLMANLSHNTSVNPQICEGNESIVMHNNPTYATAAETIPNYVQT